MPTYVDRQTLSALAPTIQHDLAMDDRDYADVVNVFLVAYTIAYLISGRITDKLGTRAGMVIFVTWWSIANMATAASHGIRSLSVFRFLLGLGEAGVWPAASKAVSEWFPARSGPLRSDFTRWAPRSGPPSRRTSSFRWRPIRTRKSFHWQQTSLGTAPGMAFILTGALGLLGDSVAADLSETVRKPVCRRQRTHSHFVRKRNPSAGRRRTLDLETGVHLSNT